MPEEVASVREPAPAIFPVFRSRLTVAVLARAVRRLEAAGVVRSRMVGRTRLVRANREAPFYRALRDLVVIVLGPAEVLGDELAGLKGIDAAAVFGSWAARAA